MTWVHPALCRPGALEALGLEPGGEDDEPDESAYLRKHIICCSVPTRQRRVKPYLWMSSKLLQASAFWAPKFSTLLIGVDGSMSMICRAVVMRG